MILARALLQIWMVITSVSTNGRAAKALAAALIFGTLLQGYSQDCALGFAAEENKSAPIEEEDNDTESQAKTHYLAGQSCNKRLIQHCGKSVAFVRPRTRAAYAQRTSHSLFHRNLGAGLDAVPMRC